MARLICSARLLRARAPTLSFQSSLHGRAALHASTRLYLRSEDEVKPQEAPPKHSASSEQDKHAGDQLASLQSLLKSSPAESLPTLNIHHIRAPHTGNVKLLSFNRPKARNAISRQLLYDLSQQIEAIHEETHAGTTRALILASEVDSAFCAGADLAERRNMTQKETKDFLAQLRYTFKRISSLPIPSISSVSGFALGGGLELALCTHLRVFSSNATVGLPETSLAIIPGGGGTFRLPQIVGLAKARELVLSAGRLSGKEALEIGLCNRYVASDDSSIRSDLELTRKLTLWESIKLANAICKNGPIALRAAIQAMRDGGSEDAENAAYETVLQTKDRVEALAAFAEKRLPTFAGD